jgi:2'-5' RNA ligase
MRLFVAIELPDSIKDRLGLLAGGLHGARWSDVDQMHLTLRFIGEVDAAQADDVAAALHQVWAQSFPLSLVGLGDFSARGRVQTLWAGVEHSPALMALQARIESAVRRAGVEPEKRKFHPHVTLARFKEGRPDLGRYFAQHEPFRSAPFDVHEFTLFSSVLGSDGPAHHVEARYPLSIALAGIASSH